MRRTVALGILSYASLVTLGLVAGFVLVTQLGSSWQPWSGSSVGSNSGLILFQPRSVEHLVRRSDVIVIGRVGRVLHEGTIGSYNEADNARNELPGDLISSRLPVTDFEIVVEETLRDDGRAKSTPPILRLIGRADAPRDEKSEFPMSRMGDRHLFFLTRNPDNQTYGLLFGPWSRLDIDGSVVTASDGPRSPLAFSPEQEPARFVELVRRLAQQTPAGR